jgi:hypothetical protein
MSTATFRTQNFAVSTGTMSSDAGSERMPTPSDRPGDSTTSANSNWDVQAESDTSDFKPAEDEKRRALASVRRLQKPFAPGAYRVSGLDSWTGKITEIEGDVFTAELVPDRDGQTVLADFTRDQIGNEVVEVGDIVYLTVRMVRGFSGYTNRTSSIRLRRLGAWTREEVEAQKVRAAETVVALEGLVG